jgi:hypothetical protein
VPFSHWLADATARLGGPQLVRRQLCTFLWSGVADEATAAAVAAEERARALAHAKTWATVPPGPKLYDGFGAWLAATVRTFVPETCAFELK